MTDERENSAELPADRSLSHATAVGEAAGSANINPYQAPPYHPDGAGNEIEPVRQHAPSLAFWVISVGAMAVTLLAIGVSGGLSVPLFLAVLGGTIRASVMFTRQKGSRHGQIPSEVLLITSTFVTLLLMFCCAIAFATICTGGVLATSDQGVSIWIWTVASGLAALAAFAFMFIRSMKWGA